jgi:hypothetical protein
MNPSWVFSLLSFVSDMLKTLSPRRMAIDYRLALRQ